MTNAKHTPGPWVWRDDVTTGEYDLSPGVLTTNLTDGTPWGDEIDRANASLIAAAPELLDALKLILEHCNNNVEVGTVGERVVERVEETALAAIAKAEGH